MSEPLDPGSGLIDLNQRMLDLGLSFEPPEQLRARIERDRIEIQHQVDQEALDNQHQRERVLQEVRHRQRVFWSVFGVAIVGGAVSFWVISFDRSATTETLTWARTVASAIVAGVIGYFGGTAGKASA